MSSIAAEHEGTWEQCQAAGCEMMFKRHKEGHKRYSLSDKIGVCPLCIDKKKRENGTMPKPHSASFEFKHKSPDSKPEKDSL